SAKAAAASAKAAASSAKAAMASAKARGEASRDRMAARQQQLASQQASRSRAAEARRAGLSEQVKRRRGERTSERRRNRWTVPLLLLVVLLLLLRECEPEPELPPVAEAPSGPAVARPVVEAPVPPPPPAPPPPDVARRDRPEMAAPPARTPAWLVGFRMQVSARSPRLAECFEGVDRPGRIKWTASVEPRSGQVGDHLIEPQLLTGELSRREKACIEEVLSTPDYRIKAPEETGPRRVSVVLEF
ncbi:MAG: hypothetical protein AAF078_12040, partial [Planctomycetota bacterium]